MFYARAVNETTVTFSNEKLTLLSKEQKCYLHTVRGGREKNKNEEEDEEEKKKEFQNLVMSNGNDHQSHAC